jgi:glycosyltransferase involved in cell wall biosynthesis
MKICIWYKLYQGPWGGGNQFLIALSKCISRSGHQVINKPDSTTDIVLLNSHNRGANRFLDPLKVEKLQNSSFSESFTPFGKFIRESSSKCRRAALIHRLDGIPHLIRGVHTQADSILRAINQLSDGTIFQSKYSKNAFVREGITPLFSKVILNGVDPDFFFPELKNEKPPKNFKFIASSWSSNPKKGFSYLAELSQVPDVEISFAGRWCKEIPSKNVKILGILNSKTLADVYRSSHALVHASEVEACSNSILEGLACGLPILYKDSTSNKELAFSYGVAISKNAERDVQKLRDMWKEYKENVISNRRYFLIDRPANEYLDFFREILDQLIPKANS